MGTNINQTITPSIRPYLVFTLIFAVPVCSFLWLTIMRDASAWKGLAINIFFLISILTWIKFHIIRLYPDRLCYYSIFNGKKKIDRAGIKKWSLKIGVFKYTDRFKPTVRLEIVTNTDNITIPVKLFRQEDINAIMDWLPAEKEVRA